MPGISSLTVFTSPGGGGGQPPTPWLAQHPQPLVPQDVAQAVQSSAMASVIPAPLQPPSNKASC